RSRRRPPAHASSVAVGQRREDNQARYRTVLGDRRRVPQSARRARLRRVVHRLRLPARRDRRVSDLTLDAVREGTELPALRYDVTSTTVVLGAIAARDWRPMHHDYHFATERNGTRDIFLNTPNQAAWFERYVTDWTGPHGRIGKVTFRMRDSVFPDDTMTFRGAV